MNNSKRQVLSIVSSVISVFVTVGISFFLTRYLISTIGKEAYSFYPLASNFVSYMTVITLALNSMASRYITIEITRNNRDKAHQYFSSIFYSNVILSIILLVPMALIVVFVDHILNVSANLVADVQILFAFTFASMLINLLSSVFGIATFAKNRMNWRALRDIGQNILRAIILVALFYFCRPTVIFLGIAAFVVALVNGSVQYIFSRILMPEYKVRISEFNKKSVFELVSSGIWNSINNIGSLLTMSVSILIANILIGSSESGDLAIIQLLPQLMAAIVSAVYGVLLAKITVVYANGDRVRTFQYVQKSQRILGIICTVPIILIILLGKIFFSLWVPGENAAYLHTLSIITIFPILVHSTMWTVYGLNVTNNKLKIPAIVLIGSGLLSICTSILLVKFTNLGVYAVIIANSVCNGFYYLFFIPNYTARKMETSAWTFYRHIIRSFIYFIVFIAIGIPIVAVLEKYISSWLRLIIFGASLELLGVLLYLLIIFDSDYRKKILVEIKKVMKRRLKA